MKTSENNLKALHTNLMVTNVSDTLHYYEAIGFIVDQKFPEENPEWAMVKKDNISLMFQSTDSLQKEFPRLKEQNLGGTLSLWIQVENIESYYIQIKDKVEIIKPLGITEYNGATEFVLVDINGYILHFSTLDL